jgi:hypothetical protein
MPSHIHLAIPRLHGRSLWFGSNFFMVNRAALPYAAGMRLDWVISTALAIALAGCCGSTHPKPPLGFEALFNGRNLEGWRGLPGDPPIMLKLTPMQREEAQIAADERMRDHWRATSRGILKFDGGGDNLCTVRDFSDFELLVDWRIPKGGDSGIYIRGNPQVQIWDNPAPDNGSGGLYNNKNHPSKPLVVADRPVDEWNTFRIHVVGDRVTVHLNDALVVDDTPMENFWDRGQPFPTSGPIELQAHGGPLEFRNVFVREIHAER